MVLSPEIFVEQPQPEQRSGGEPATVKSEYSTKMMIGILVVIVVILIFVIWHFMSKTNEDTKLRTLEREAQDRQSEFEQRRYETEQAVYAEKMMGATDIETPPEKETVEQPTTPVVIKVESVEEQQESEPTKLELHTTNKELPDKDHPDFQD